MFCLASTPEISEVDALSNTLISMTRTEPVFKEASNLIHSLHTKPETKPPILPLLLAHHFIRPPCLLVTTNHELRLQRKSEAFRTST